MKFELMKLPYADNALEPHISAETISYHYGKHHATYVKNLNNLIEGTEFADQSLIEIIKNSSLGIFNNAAQVYNHDFYWLGLSPDATSASDKLTAQINKDFGSMDAFKKEFFANALSLFGSGWVWLVLANDGTLSIEKHSNADNPIAHGKTPLLTCDVWEHAYYIDYRNGRADYLEKWWQLVNWKFVSDNIA